MIDSPIVKRLCERKCFCRGCDKPLDKGTEIIFTYSWRNRGQNIMFCMNCATQIADLLDKPVE